MCNLFENEREGLGIKLVLGAIVLVVIVLVSGLLIWKLSGKNYNHSTTGTEILDLSKELYEMEVKYNDLRMYTIEYQGKTNASDKADRAPQSLFHVANDDRFRNQSTTVRLLKRIFDKYRLKTPDNGPEHMQEEWYFLEAILQTPIMSKTMQFLHSKTELKKSVLPKKQKRGPILTFLNKSKKWLPHHGSTQLKNQSSPFFMFQNTIKLIPQYQKQSNHSTSRHSTFHNSPNKTMQLVPHYKNITNHSTSRSISTFHHSPNKTMQLVPHYKNITNHSTSRHSTFHHSPNKTMQLVPHHKNITNHSTSRSISTFHHSKNSNKTNWYHSKPFSKLHHFRNKTRKTLLRFKKDVGATKQQQLDFLKKIWFTNSAGNINIRGSGFERVFMGALGTEKNVTGLHNWIYFAEQERLGHLDYKGYIKYEALGKKNQHYAATVRVAFHNTTKTHNTLFIGTSPELEMSLYTACFVLNSRGNCSVDLGGKRLGLQVSTGLLHHNKQRYIVAAHPKIY